MRLAAAVIAILLLVGRGYICANSAPRYSVIPLQSLPGTETDETAHCELRALNSKGESAGSAGARGRFRAVWWDARGSIHLLGKPSEHLSEAEGINDSEQVIAYATDSYYTLTARLFVVDRQGEHLITPPKGTETRGFIGGEAINNAGQLLFNTQTGGSLPFRAYEDDHDTLTDLGHLSLNSVDALTRQVQAHALNNAGAAVGNSGISSKGADGLWLLSVHAFLWQKGVMTDLGVLPGYDDYSATALNDQGDVIGTLDRRSEQSDSVPFFQGHGFLWRHGVMTDLGTLPGCRYTEATGINNLGQIVGNSYRVKVENNGDYSQTGGALGSGVFLWQDGKMQDLQPLVPAGWKLQSAVAINDRGDILCTGYHNGMPSRTLGSGGFILHRL